MCVAAIIRRLPELSERWCLVRVIITLHIFSDNFSRVDFYIMLIAPTNKLWRAQALLHYKHTEEQYYLDTVGSRTGRSFLSSQHWANWSLSPPALEEKALWRFP